MLRESRAAAAHASAVSLETLEPRRLMVVYGGIDFPQGARSFADEVIAYSPVGTINALAKKPAESLGVPDYNEAVDEYDGYVSLGRGGRLKVGFVDNLLTNSGNANDDLFVFEIGGFVENTFVFVRPTAETKPLLPAAADADGDGYYAVGRVFGGTSRIDIDAVFAGHAAGRLKFNAVLLVDDPNEGNHTNDTPGADIDAVGAISSVTAPPRVSLVATDTGAAETAAGASPNTGLFTFTRTGSTAASLTAFYTITGTATNGTDYDTLATSITFAAGQASKTLTVRPKNDAIGELAETVKLTLSSRITYQIDPAKTGGTVTIADNDPAPTKPVVSVSKADDGAETIDAAGTAGSTGSFVVRRSTAAAPLTLSFNIGGTAALNSDYRLRVTGASSFTVDAATKTLTLTLAAGVRLASVVVGTVNDANNAEGNEGVTLTLKSNASYTIDSTRASATVSIADRPV